MQALSVEASTGAKKSNGKKTKIFVGNIHRDAKVEDIRPLFEEYGEVVEADILMNYGFIVSFRFFR